MTIDGDVRWEGSVIAHLDMDSFFAAVEIRDDPSLEGKPLVVGGSGQRGVVASCNYEARIYGIHSAMPSVHARQLCPNLTFIDGRYGRYSEVSEQLHEVLRSITPVIEPIGLDEAFMDIRGVQRLFGAPREIALLARRRVEEELGLRCAVGVGTTKMVAKLASKAAKPKIEGRQVHVGTGVVVVEPGEELAFLHPQPVARLWGVGPTTQRRLRELGVHTIAQLSSLPVESLMRAVGRAQGTHLAALARGEDDDPVRADRVNKSLGHEETFSHDLRTKDEMVPHLIRMAESVASQIRSSSLAARTLTIKAKYADFTVVTRSTTLGVALDTGPSIAEVALGLIADVEPQRGIRLLGVSASNLVGADDPRQLAFSFDDESSDFHVAASRSQSRWEHVSATIDEVRERFGRESLGTVSMVRRGDGINVPGRRQAPWGPSSDDGTESVADSRPDAKPHQSSHRPW